MKIPFTSHVVQIFRQLAHSFSYGHSVIKKTATLRASLVNSQQVLPGAKVTVESQALRDLVASDYLALDGLIALIRSLATLSQNCIFQACNPWHANPPSHLHARRSFAKFTS